MTEEEKKDGEFLLRYMTETAIGMGYSIVGRPVLLRKWDTFNPRDLKS